MLGCAQTNTKIATAAFKRCPFSNLFEIAGENKSKTTVKLANGLTGEYTGTGNSFD